MAELDRAKLDAMTRVIPLAAAIGAAGDLIAGGQVYRNLGQGKFALTKSPLPAAVALAAAAALLLLLAACDEVSTGLGVNPKDTGRDTGDGFVVPSYEPYENRDWPRPEKGFAAMMHLLDRDVERAVRAGAAQWAAVTTNAAVVDCPETTVTGAGTAGEVVNDVIPVTVKPSV